MLLKSDILSVLENQKILLRPDHDILNRSLASRIRLDTNYVLVITGIRRCGKSTLLRHLLDTGNIRGTYLNFEDPRLNGFELTDFTRLDDILQEAREDGFVVFDEIQNVPGWEIYVRSCHEKGRKMILTGSNASLLSAELGTKLTGRYLSYELFPFSYPEYLEFTHLQADKDSLLRYLSEGGFPEYLRYKENASQHRLLDDILYRDIVARYGIKHHSQLKQLALFLITNSSKLFTYNSLKKLFSFGSPNTVIDFVSYLENSYLLFQVPKFEYSLKKQLVNPRKIYSVDPGFSSVNSLSFSLDIGRKLENVVFLHLRSLNNGINYFNDKGECDFIVTDRGTARNAIQVCTELTEDNKKREFDGLLSALKAIQSDVGYILTLDQEDHFTIEGKSIEIVPVWKWMQKKEKLKIKI
jgi:uncharacterized protein